MPNAMPVAIQRIIPNGIGFTAKQMTVVSLVLKDPDVNIVNGFGFGFIITPVAADASFAQASPHMFVKVRGVGKISNDILLVTPGYYYDMPFDALDFVGDPSGSVVTRGTFIINIAVKESVRIFPSAAKLTLNDFPASSGGNPNTYTNFVLGQNLTGTPPTLATDGLQIGNASRFYASVRAAGAATITGGNVDIYRTDYDGNWMLAAQGIPLPTGVNRAAIPMDEIGPHAFNGRIAVVTNGVTVSDASATVATAIVIQ